MGACGPVGELDFIDSQLVWASDSYKVTQEGQLECAHLLYKKYIVFWQWRLE